MVTWTWKTILLSWLGNLFLWCVGANLSVYAEHAPAWSLFGDFLGILAVPVLGVAGLWTLLNVVFSILSLTSEEWQ